MTDDPRQRRALLVTALVVSQLAGRVPEARMVRRWLDTWTGIGHVAVGMDRQGLAGDFLHLRHKPRGAGEKIKLSLTIFLSPAQAETLTARAIGEGKNLAARVAEILERS